jgi:hypothetical protein
MVEWKSAMVRASLFVRTLLDERANKILAGTSSRSNSGRTEVLKPKKSEILIQLWQGTSGIKR